MDPRSGKDPSAILDMRESEAGSPREVGRLSGDGRDDGNASVSQLAKGKTRVTKGPKPSESDLRARTLSPKESPPPSPKSRTPSPKKGVEGVLEPVLRSSGIGDAPMDFSGRSPLSYAAEQGEEEIVKLLLDKGVDVNNMDRYDRSPLSYAAKQGRKEIVRLLLDSGADADSRDLYGRSPLSYAAEQGEEETVRLLLDRGAYADNMDERGRSPLSYAAENGHGEMVDVLLARGYVNPDTMDKYGRSTISYAATNGHRAIVKTLLIRKGNTSTGGNNEKGLLQLIQSEWSRLNSDSDRASLVDLLVFTGMRYKYTSSETTLYLKDAEYDKASFIEALVWVEGKQMNWSTGLPDRVRTAHRKGFEAGGQISVAAGPIIITSQLLRIFKRSNWKAKAIVFRSQILHQTDRVL
ncbi:hypothetical protein DL768_004760 [Monosporascus sp. mg162]|nr:hypothetical protein DL768_004760 [Monosporascus sp. mg162]